MPTKSQNQPESEKILASENTPEENRLEAFRKFADRLSTKEIVYPPLLLPSEERRQYVRVTLREDHQFRISNNPEGAQAKFDKLADSAFKFFRGTALLFYRDYAGSDSHLPAVFTVGDIHPENFGVMPNENGAPFFGINDFDEACIAPFSYDIKRGVVGYYMAAKENGFKKKDRKKITKAFVHGYMDGLKEFARDDREKSHEYRIDNSPPMIVELLKSAGKSRKAFLGKIVDFEKERFMPTEKIVPHSKHCQKFQKIVNKYVKDNGIDQLGKAKDFFKVKDVAIKKNSGTASMGLDRYYVLIQANGGAPEDDVILEFKQSRTSALKGLVPKNIENVEEKAAMAVLAHSIHLVGGDPYYGRTEFDDKSFLVREHSPYKNDIKIKKLKPKAMAKYADICGRTLAQTHARSDEDTGMMEGSAEENILSAVKPDVFIYDMVRFGKIGAKRVYRDYELFRQDHAVGAFDFVRREE